MKTTQTLKLIFLSLITASMSCLAQFNPPTTCDNLDFYKGDFTGWKGSCAVNTSTTPPYTYCWSSTIEFRNTIMKEQGVTDPFTGGNVKTIPPGEKYSVRLGNGGVNPNPNANNAWTNGVGGEIDKLSYRMHIDQSNCLLTYKYAVVLQDSNINSKDYKNRSDFFTSIKLDNGDVVGPGGCVLCIEGPCDFDTRKYKICTPDEYKKLGAVAFKDEKIYYTGWETKVVDLRKFTGQWVNIEFTSRDNPNGQLFGYAYISAKCSPMEIKTEICGSTAKLSAPEGFKYRWSNNAITKDVEILNFTPNYTVSVEVMGSFGCVSTLSLTLNPNNCNTTTGLETQSIDQSITFYPNPVNTELTLSTSSSISKYSIINQLGEMVLIGNLNEQKKINVNSLPNGFYFLKLEDQQGLLFQTKFIKE